jgi:integrase
LDKAMLTIPAADMKRRKAQKVNGRPHFVPLAPQAVAILRDLHPLTGHRRYVFPSLRTSERPMSDNTVNAALRRMGFSGDEMVAHGFRAMARTLIVENIPGIDPDVIEAQLAHGKSGPLGAAYDRAEYMEQRRRMMATWADYLDKLRTGADVIPLRA